MSNKLVKSEREMLGVKGREGEDAHNDDVYVQT
jgi:hypothetical protein